MNTPVRGLPVRTTGRLLRCAVTACCALLLAACAAGSRTMNQVPQAPAYVPPVQGERATLLVRVSQPEGHYVVSTFEQPVSCSKRHEITSGIETAPERFRTEIGAGRLQTVSFSYRRSRATCEVTLSFEPQRGHTYVLRSGIAGQRCSMAIVEAGANPDARVPVVQREIVGFARADGACRPLASTELPGATAARPQSIDDFRQLLESE